MRDLFFVAAGGALGASLRHLASRAALHLLPTSFPWGTSLINVSGCLLMGVVAGLVSAGGFSPSTRLFLATGVLGGYTTFSAFGLETQRLLSEGRVGTALAYVVGQVLVGVLSVYVGLATARRLV